MNTPAPNRQVAVLALTLIAGMLLAGAVLQPVMSGGETALTLLGVTLPTACTFRRATGLPCAGCGLTRAVVLLLHGRLSDSLAVHPFGAVVVALGFIQVPPRVAALTGRTGRWIRRWDRVWIGAVLAALGLMMVRWTFQTASVLLRQ